MTIKHIPVMADEILDLIDKNYTIFMDGTV
jgi:16S rRNA C1402 N4-methylase RsmH